MNKTIFAIVLLTIAGAVYAQSPKWGYGDTVYAQTAPDTTYYYQWWCEGLGPATNTYLRMDVANEINQCMWWGQYNYTERPLQVAGIAICVDGHNSYYTGWEDFFTDSLERQEYLLLFDATPDSLPLKAQVPYNLYDPHRYMYFDFNSPSTGCCEGSIQSFQTFPLYEYYFKNPVTVEDSFYVGATGYNMVLHVPSEAGGLPSPNTYPTYYSIMQIRWYNANLCSSCPNMPLQKYVGYHCLFNYPDGCTHYDTIYRSHNRFFLVFPLLEPDTASYVCQGVRGLRVVDMSSTFVQLAWNSHSSHLGFEVNYFPEGTDPDSGTVITCSTPTCRIEGFDRTKSWRANVRALCDYGGATFYSDWSSILFYRYYPPTPPPEEGIAAEDHDPYVTLMPNPARENVQVISSYGLKKIEVVDGQGRTVATQDADGHAALMELKGLASGHYIVLVYTEQGITTKRLVVE